MRTRIAVLRALHLGDFLTAVPAYRAIRQAFPAAHITLLAPREYSALLDLTGDVIDEIADAHELTPLPSQANDADIGINLHGAGPQSHRLLIDARVRRLIAFRNPLVPESAQGSEHDPDEHEVFRWCRMLQESGIPADPTALDLTTPRTAVPQRVRDATLIHPGASRAARCWPDERWAAVARAERRAGRRVVITGSAGEVARAYRIAEASGVSRTHVYAGRTNLRELAALVAASARVVCGDTGIAHLATAYRRPSVVLFGPTSPTAWGPPPRPYHRVLWSGVKGDPHANSIDPGMLRISAASVIAALEALPTARMSRETA
jgi:ADP-heptose:LPS heptosyltransferase